MKSSNLVLSSTNESDIVSYSHDGDHGDQDQEESGWTAYFDDYFATKTPHPASKHINHTNDYDNDVEGEGEYGSHGGDSSSPSMVSDATSCAEAWKSQYKTDDERHRRAEKLAACSSLDRTQMVIHKKMRFKPTNRHKRIGDYYDDSLEDTASSPVSSPKGLDSGQRRIRIRSPTGAK